MDLVKLR